MAHVCEGASQVRTVKRGQVVDGEQTENGK